jgi:hypothetical protein
MLKLKTAREIIPAVIDEQMLLAVLASFRLSQCRFDFILLPVSEKSKLIIRKDSPRKHKAIIAGRKAILVITFL